MNPILPLSIVLGLAGLLRAQFPVLAPTDHTPIDVDPVQGQLVYSSIHIPAGVIVAFTGNYPVRIRVMGDVRIDGVLSVSPSFTPWWYTQSGPGFVTTGVGAPGSMYGTWYPIFGGYIYSGSYGASARHSTLYGTAIPFDLAGGSPGGDTIYIPAWANSVTPGGTAGGTLVIEATGRIDVGGYVEASGGWSGSVNPHSQGSGGSILLRGNQGLTVAPTGTVRALPEGIIRLDNYGTAPQVLGTVQPPATVVQQPDLAEVQAPILGGTWELRTIAPRGDVVFLAASFQPGSGSNAYGTYGIDLGNAITFTVVAAPTTGHDPIGTFQLPVPNVPQLAGLDLWVQGLNWFSTQPPRYTPTLHTRIL